MKKPETATCPIDEGFEEMLICAERYNCISAVDLALHKPNYETEFAAFEPKEET